MPPSNISTSVTLLAIISADGYISKGQGVPWELPDEKAHFRAYAAGKWCLLGRRTYEEMLGWFRDHHPLVLTTRENGPPLPLGQRVRSVGEAVALASAAAQPELVVLGGGAAYEAAMPWADRLEITHVDQILGGGITFPAISPRDWEPVRRLAHPIDERHAQAFEIVSYRRAARLPVAA